jgi:DNA primase catalytic core
MKIENVGFFEALEILADKSGIPIPKKQQQILIKSNITNDNENNKYNSQKFVEINRKRLFTAADWLKKIYHHELQNNKEAELARTYLNNRGIDSDCIEKFQIGYAPLDSNWLISKVKSDSEKLQILELVGNLINSNKQSGYSDQQSENLHNYPPRYFDRFRGRLIFPICDTQNRTIAFGGRIIPNSQLESPAKYINSPDTPLFSKHHTLYGLDTARQKMKETRRAVIMEGYTDCIIAHKFGFNDSVAVLGTALGNEHIKILKRFADKMILVLDGDTAGKKRAEQVMGFFVAQGVDLSILTLPDGNDPCEFLIKYGSESFNKLLNSESIDVLEHAFRTYTNGVDLQNDINGATKALDTIIELVAQTPIDNAAPDNPVRIRVEKTVQNLSHRFRVSERSIWNRLQEKRLKATKRINSNNPETGFNTISNNADKSNNITTDLSLGTEINGDWNSPDFLPDSLEREMIELWLVDKTSFYEFWDSAPLERCRSPITIAIYKKCNELIERDKLVTFANLVVMFDDPRMKSYLDDAAESGEKKLLSGQNSQLINSIKNAQQNLQDENILQKSSDFNGEIKMERQIDPDIRSRLIREIIDGFDRRDAERNQIDKVNQLRNNSLSEEEKKRMLLQMQESLRQLQEEKKERYEIGD